MKQIIYDAANFNVEEGDDGKKILVITEPIPPAGIAHIFVMPDELAAQVAAMLRGETPVVTAPKPQLLVPGR